jgi:hypothetical protein
MYSNKRNTDERNLASGKHSLSQEAHVVRWRPRHKGNSKGTKQFEVLVHPGTLTEYRAGRRSFDSTVMQEMVYLHPFTRGEAANLKDIREELGDEKLNLHGAIEKILKEGDWEPDAEERRKEAEKYKVPDRTLHYNLGD